MPKKLYTITVPHTGYTIYEVKANTRTEAIALVEQGKGKETEECTIEAQASTDEWEIEEGEDE